MLKKCSYFLIFTLLLLSCIWLYFTVWQAPKSYADFQVKKVAPITKNYLLKIKKHISDSPRPAETFHFPIPLGEHGPTTSLYAGNNQYPFYCMTLVSKLGQPLIDNQQGLGVPVYQSIDRKQQIKGYSKDCSVLSKISYYTIDDKKNIQPLSETQARAFKEKSQQLLRVEQGSINRFIYTIVMPIANTEVSNRLAKSQWNKRLIYQFNGGSGIGYRQGRQLASRIIDRQVDQLLLGYALISSSGNRTSYTYNMLLAEDTARRVKLQFVSLYGEPLYTVGIGGSGGGLAQYLIAQNADGILDGLLPLYSYPDMITQTTYALDCDLLNNYFTFRAEDRAKWGNWRERQKIEGMNALNDFPQRTGYLQPINQLMAGFVPSFPQGNSECINGYFGLSSFINNPRQGFIRDFFHLEVVKQTKWSYWQDLKQILGEDQHGFGLSTWDNVGVQYGLNALRNQQISIDDFIDINGKIGGWKAQNMMKAENIAIPFGRKLPLWLSLWGNQNISETEQGVAARHHGSISAMHNAYRSGQVFIGRVSLPIIDIRHYLEDELDMHHVSASFYSRLRIQEANGHFNNQVIWLADKAFNPVNKAFDLMHQWLMSIKQGQSISDAKPVTLTDSCFAENGDVIAQGDGVFNGEWNKTEQGMCQRTFPMYSNSRIQAGADWAGDIFKCQLISVSQAVQLGIYGDIDITAIQKELEIIFPEGVCHYALGDIGRPANL